MPLVKVPVNTTVSGPTEEINIPLVRADHYVTANVFRLAFEVFLTIASATGGVVGTMPDPTTFHLVTFVIFGLAALAFMLCSVRHINFFKEV